MDFSIKSLPHFLLLQKPHFFFHLVLKSESPNSAKLFKPYLWGKETLRNPDEQFITQHIAPIAQ